MITFAAKTGGADPNLNPLLRMAIQNAKNENMPKENIESAIKRATSKDEKDLTELVYEGYGPFGVAVIVECTSDNPTRTVANMRSYLTRAGGSLGKSGSVDYLFTRRGVFRVATADIPNLEDLELELIDHGLDEVIQEEEETVFLVSFESFGDFQKALESRNIPVQKADCQRFPNTIIQLTPEQEAEVQKMLDKIEDDEDVQAVYHNL
jgi:YebC/PmpR family DNA-binding regulatory protein